MRLAKLLLAFSITCLPYTLSANESLAPKLPEAIQEIYPTVMNQQIWVAGGISNELPGSAGKMTAKVHFWSPEYASWQSAPSLPEGRHHTYLIAVENRLFAFGGFVNSQGQWTNSRDVLMLDKGANAWQKVASLPFALSETVGAVLDGKVHLAGGRSPNSEKNGQWQHSLDVSEHLVFDPNSFTFTEAAPLPSARNSAASAQVNGRWFVLGGRTVGGEPNSDMLEYLPETDTWQAHAALPKARAGHAAAVIDNAITVFGGEHSQGVDREVFSYDLTKQQWRKTFEWQTPRHGLGAVTLNGEIWLVGGATKVGLSETSREVNNANVLLEGMKGL
ncbi:MAG: kelch repeat-containing protein [Pseudomonadota bacterium]|nr:kelch repeat-containing protein [Pseudomonadota bacterium]